jgi:hypothetical protein
MKLSSFWHLNKQTKKFKLKKKRFRRHLGFCRNFDFFQRNIRNIQRKMSKKMYTSNITPKSTSIKMAIEIIVRLSFG